MADPKPLSRILEGVISLLYPAQCPGCGASVGRVGTLCAPCWAEAEFITGPACAGCGVPAPPGLGDEAEAGDAGFVCDGCAQRSHPWQGARAALVYRGTGRRLALALKHGDRADLAPVLGQWLAQAAAPLIRPGMVVVAVPSHPRRLLRRRYNQALLLAAQLARRHGLVLLPGALRRVRHTPMQDHRHRDERFANQRDAIRVPARQADRIRGRPVLLVDDVMASGATMTVATQALRDAGAASVDLALLARAVRDA